jgi:2-polyprenyl-3-methyl-5-hydroxy-6-metoxy-1,4-benzoquinol methylase
MQNFKRVYRLLTGDMPLEDIYVNQNYKGYWPKRNSSDHLNKRRKKRIAKRMALIADIIQDGSSVLDIGCGNGDLLSYISWKHPNCRLQGIDISSEAVKTTSQKGFKALELDINNVNFDEMNEFDYIIMAEFIEHMQNPEKLLFELKKILRKKIIT